jgi:hypothetical protein
MITKYTKCEVIEVKSADEKIEGGSKLSSFNHIPNDTYRTDDGYVYVKVRAISSRVNKNFDGWPVNELAGMEEEDFRNLSSNLIKETSVEKESADKEITKFLKAIKKELGFEHFYARNGHIKVFHPKYGDLFTAEISSSPKNSEHGVENAAHKIKEKFPSEWGTYQYKNKYPGNKRYLGETQPPVDLVQMDKAAAAPNTLTFTKDSAIKSKGDYGFRTFIGRPIFIDHNNSDPQRTRGVIVDAMLHVEPSHKTASDSYWGDAPDNHKPETWIELLLEVDAKSFPKLAKALVEGKVNAVSMGCNVEYTLCSVCNNKAASVDEYCNHIKKKGATFKTGNISKLAYEDCYNINFFEISAVFDPADVTALFTEPVKTSSVKTAAEVPEVSSDFIKAAEDFMAIMNQVEEKVEEGNSTLDDEEPFLDQLDNTMSNWAKTLRNKYQHEELNEVLQALKEYKDIFTKAQEQGLNSWADVESPQQLQVVESALNNWLGMLSSWIDVFVNQEMGMQRADLAEKQQNFDSSLSYDDYDFLMDTGIDPNSFNKGSHRSKDANPETKELESFSKSSSVDKQADSVTAPNKVDTLKEEKPCPIGLAGECGLDDESGRCEKCGYREPPAPLDDPDLSKAKDFDRQKEESLDETRDETKDLIDQLKRTLSKNQKRSVNRKMNEKTHMTLTANVKEVPSDEKLAELGWAIPEKQAGVAANTVPVAEDGQAASDRPKEQRVISDQTKPVESTTKVALGELPQIPQPNGGESTPQYKNDKNNETSGISEHEPAQMAEQYAPVKREVEEPQYADEGYTKDIKNHNPSTMPEQYQKVKKVVDKPQYSDEPGTSGISEHHAELHKSNTESPVLAAIKLADLEVELGLNDAEMKYARVAELENEDLNIVQAKYETLSKIKESGLAKRESAPSKKLASFPSLKGVKESSTSSSTTVPDDAIFG